MKRFPMGGPESDTYLSLPHYFTLSCGETLLDAVPRLLNHEFCLVDGLPFVMHPALLSSASQMRTAHVGYSSPGPRSSLPIHSPSPYRTL